ncbi:MAG: RNB domain-containing ribonuclease [Bryobacteraceae bacterium]|nr:RNB domain-containing ribonuclease [Bryobacteraceae bacterium]
MIERGLEPDFPPEAIEQADRISSPAQDSAIPDLRRLSWCSIDNDDSKDLDQLTVAEPLDGGVVRIRVAVADVDSLVAKGSPVDDHARRNTTSVYTPAQVFPMLPDRLSTDLTSLNPSEDRVAVVISYTVGNDGNVESGAVQRALVRNHAKLAYNSVNAMAGGRFDAPTDGRSTRLGGSDPPPGHSSATAEGPKIRRRCVGSGDHRTESRVGERTRSRVTTRTEKPSPYAHRRFHDRRQRRIRAFPRN